MTRLRVASAIALTALLAGCEDPESPPLPPPIGDVVVMNGVDPKGITVLASPGSEATHLAFDPFDGASFTMRNDTVASASSKGSGDVLFVGLLSTKAVQKIQMPAASNPANVQFAPPKEGVGTRLYVALRDVGEVAEVPLPTTSGPIVRHVNAGLCPVDVIATPTKVWALDSNQRCSSDYATMGPSRMIPLPGKGSVDTITFLSAVVGAQRAYVVGNYAYILSSGDYAAMQGAVTKVDLASRNSIVVPLNPDYYGMSMRIGENGYLYVTATPNFGVEAPLRTYAIDLETMNFGGTREAMSQHLRLRKSNGDVAECFAATADTLGNVYCVENGSLTATVYVFNSAGNQIRSAPAGSPAFDIDLR